MGLIEVMKGLELPYGAYVVVGGGVLEALGIRLTADIDIVVKAELFEQFLQRGDWIQGQTPSGKMKLKKYMNHERLKKVEIFLEVNAGDFNPSAEELIARSLSIEGLSFISIPDLIRLKEAYGRVKDLKDIELLQQHLAT